MGFRVGRVGLSGSAKKFRVYFRAKMRVSGLRRPGKENGNYHSLITGLQEL